MKIDLKTNRVLLTGATSGIGESIVHQLSRAGATVAIHYHKRRENAEALKKKAGNRAQIFQADLSDPEQTRRLFDEVLTAFGRIDTLINNAGVFTYAPIDRKTDEWLERWQNTMTINLTSAGILCKLAVLHFQEHHGGRIINIASRAAFRGDTLDYLAYAASKGGLVSLTRTIARTCGKEDIKAFLVAPGFVRTPMAEEFIQRHGEETIVNEIALTRLTESDDVSPTVLFLASGMMDHATGCTIDINAGSYMR
jgi:3-oxoacyl-[acyl-carrier protein] reductase